MSRFLPIAVAGLLVGFSELRGAQALAEEMFLEDIDGAPTLSVSGADGTTRSVRPGEALKLGDSFEVPAKAGARAVFASGAQLLIAGGTKLSLDERAAQKTGRTVPYVSVTQGEARGIVDTGSLSPPEDTGASAPAPQASPDSTRARTDALAVPNAVKGKKPLRFLIHTRAAVMGVRGTDFLVQADTGSTQVQTLTGEVELGTDLKAVRDRTAKTLLAGQQLKAELEKPLGEPQACDTAEALKQFHKRHPKLEELAKKATQESERTRLIQKFVEARAKTEAQEALEKGDRPDTMEFRGKSKKSKEGSRKPR